MSLMRAVSDREIRLKGLLDVLTPIDRDRIEQQSTLNAAQLNQFHETLKSLAVRNRISSDEVESLSARLKEWGALPLFERLAILDTIRSVVNSQ